MTKKGVHEWLKANIHSMDFPATYLGTEPGLLSRRANDAETQVVLCTPGGYEDVASNRALSLFNEQLNSKLEAVGVDLAFFPNTARELHLFQKAGVPIFSLQKKRPIGAYDVICFSIHQSLQFFVVAKMLVMSGVPVRAADRTEDHPLVIFGGQAMMSPEPVWALPDVIFLGEGDDAFQNILYALSNLQRVGATKAEQVDALSRYSGVYIPGWYKELYTKKHVLRGRGQLVPGAPKTVAPLRLRNLDNVPLSTSPWLRYTEDAATWSTSTLEVSRGCGHGCRFCQVGWTRRPYRERSLTKVKAVAEEILANSGSQTFIPYALNVGDYSRRRAMMDWVLRLVTGSVSQSSQRVDDWARGDCYVRLICEGGLTGVTLGVEGFSERLRRGLNKRVSRKQLMAACGNVFARGVQNLKLYYITSLPGEGEEDYKEFHEDIRAIMRRRDKLGAATQVRIQFTQFQAEPHTPMQWAETRPDNRPLYPTIDVLDELGVGFMFGSGTGHTAANMLSILNRGDRRMCEPLIRMATEEDFIYWPGRGKRDRRAVEKFAAFYAEQGNAHPDGVEYVNTAKPEDEVFSWDFIRPGVPKIVLWSEWQRCLAGEEGPGCVECEVEFCGACDNPDDREEHYRYQRRRETDPDVIVERAKVRRDLAVQRVRVRFGVRADHRFLPRRAVHTMFRRALLQLGVKLARRPFNLASDGIATKNWTWGVDYLDIFLREKVQDTRHITLALSNAAPGILKIDVCQIMPLRAKPMANVIHSVAYHMDLTEFDDKRISAGFEYLRQMKAEGMELPVVRRRAGFGGDSWRHKVDGIKHIHEFFCYDDQLVMVLSRLVSPYDIFAGVFKSKWRYAQNFPAERLEFHVPVIAAQDDLFRGHCDECHQMLPVNLFDEPGECLRCMYGGDRRGACG